MSIVIRKCKSACKRVYQTLDSFAGRKINGNYGGYLFDKFKYRNLNKNYRSGVIFDTGTCRGKCSDHSHPTLDKITQKADELLTRSDVVEELSRSKLKQKVKAKQVLFGLEHHIPELFEIISEDAKSEIKSFFGCDFSVREAALVRTFHVDSKISEKYETIADRYHLDINDEIIVLMFIAIETISLDNGPTHYYNKDISMQFIKDHFKKRDTHVDVFEKLMPPEKFTAEKGDWFIFDGAHVLHRASVPNKGHSRTLVQLVFEPKSQA